MTLYVSFPGADESLCAIRICLYCKKRTFDKLSAVISSIIKVNHVLLSGIQGAILHNPQLHSISCLILPYCDEAGAQCVGVTHEILGYTRTTNSVKSYAITHENSTAGHGQQWNAI